MRSSDTVLLVAGVAVCLAIAGAPSRVSAQECQPYDIAIKNLAEGGWTVLPDIPIPEGYEVDALIVGEFNGLAWAMPMVKGCVLPVPPIPLGPVKDKGTPA